MPGVTKEQIQEAREADLFAYLQFHEPGVLKRDGPNYRHKEHDSLVYVTGNGTGTGTAAGGALTPWIT